MLRLAFSPLCYMPPLPLGLFKVVRWRLSTFFAMSLLLLSLLPLLGSVLQVPLQHLPAHLQQATLAS